MVSFAAASSPAKPPAGLGFGVAHEAGVVFDERIDPGDNFFKQGTFMVTQVETDIACVKIRGDPGIHLPCGGTHTVKVQKALDPYCRLGDKRHFGVVTLGQRIDSFDEIGNGDGIPDVLVLHHVVFERLHTISHVRT